MSLEMLVLLSTHYHIIRLCGVITNIVIHTHTITSLRVNCEAAAHHSVHERVLRNQRGAQRCGVQKSAACKETRAGNIMDPKEEIASSAEWKR